MYSKEYTFPIFLLLGALHVPAWIRNTLQIHPCLMHFPYNSTTHKTPQGTKRTRHCFTPYNSPPTQMWGFHPIMRQHSLLPTSFPSTGLIFGFCLQNHILTVLSPTPPHFLFCAYCTWVSKSIALSLHDFGHSQLKPRLELPTMGLSHMLNPVWKTPGISTPTH
jgi:hypothetical protein